MSEPTPAEVMDYLRNLVTENRRQMNAEAMAYYNAPPLVRAALDAAAAGPSERSSR